MKALCVQYSISWMNAWPLNHKQTIVFMFMLYLYAPVFVVIIFYYQLLVVLVEIFNCFKIA